ncbi:MAG: hypothetical protein EXR59_01385 [Dehalococcoidia bacterium]|nr:hypothetical protein [Dehalococcoidia bacterium]
MQEIVLGGIVSGLLGLMVGLFVSGLVGLTFHNLSQVGKAVIASFVSLTLVIISGVMTGGILSVVIGLLLWLFLSVIATAMVGFAYRAMSDEK